MNKTTIAFILLKYVKFVHTPTTVTSKRKAHSKFKFKTFSANSNHSSKLLNNRRKFKLQITANFKSLTTNSNCCG